MLITTYTETWCRDPDDRNLNLPPGGRRQYAPSNRWYQPTRIKGVITHSTMKRVIFHVCFLSVFVYYINDVTLCLCHRNCGTEKLFRQFGFRLRQTLRCECTNTRGPFYSNILYISIPSVSELHQPTYPLLS